MAVPTATIALERSVPYLLERGVEQTIEAPVRHGSTGALQAPLAGSSSVSVMRPGGDFLVSGAPVLVPSSTAQYTLTPGASETLGRGWEVRWSLSIGGVVYPFRVPAILMVWLPRNTVSVVDIYREVDELRHRVPPAQGPNGDDVGWQPQIDAAFHRLIRRLVDDGRDLSQLKDVQGAHNWLLYTSILNCLRAISYDAASDLAKKETTIAHDLRRAEGEFRLVFDNANDPDARTPGRPVTMLSPVGRPMW